jgi:RNA polymerase sigma-70 factor (ECF subfamily)
MDHSTKLAVVRPVPPSSEPTDAPARISGIEGAADDVDRRLIDRLAAGELDALRELYERHKTMAFSIAYRITGEGGAAEDAVQDAFLGAWRNAGRYEASRASVRTWLLTIVHRRAIDVVRRGRRANETVEINEEVVESLSLPDVWEEVAQGFDRDAVVAALTTIAPTQREAIELAYFEGLTQVEIAQRTGAPLGTVKSRMRLGLQGLRKAFTGQSASDPTAEEATDG